MLPIRAPVTPMLAQPVAAIPAGMAYEPKWDGFRCLVFRDGDAVELWSRGGKAMGAHFPELVAGVLAGTPDQCVLDGEMVIIVGDRIEFGRLGERANSSAARAKEQARTLPASLMLWDILALGDRDLTSEPFARRRVLLEDALAAAVPPVFCSPLTLDLEVAEHWFAQFEGAGLDGVIAKPLDGRYLPGQRAMYKVKHLREADVVVGAYREHKSSSAARPLLGGLHLGLYDGADELHWVGAVSGFPDPMRAALIDMLAELAVVPGTPEWAGHPWHDQQRPGGPRRPGGAVRWGSPEDRVYHLIDPLLVATVNYDFMEGNRFRSAARFVRWRPDRDPRSCTFDQLEAPVSYNLAQILAQS